MITAGLRRFLTTCVVVSVAACTQNDQTRPGAAELGPTNVGTVNGRAIPESVFRVYALATLRKNADQLTPEERAALVDDLVGISVLVDQAQKEGLASSRSVAAQVELSRMQLVARAMANDYLAKNPVSDADLQKIYDENLPRLAPRQYKARHILLESEEEANAVLEQLRNGGDFVALATERADGPTGPNGGDLGWFTADSIVQPIANAIQTMEVGTYSAQPVRTEFGYHVLLLEDTREQEPPTLDSLRADLTSAAERQKIEDYINRLRQAADVKPAE